MDTNGASQAAITDLIMLRFDKVQREQESNPTSAAEPAPTTNGATHHHHDVKDETGSEPTSPTKRKAAEVEDEEMSDVADSPPPKKVAKKSKSTEETDEQLAKRMQAELNAPSARSTRGGGITKRKAVVKKNTPKAKKKSKAKISSDLDSDVSASEKPQKEKKGGFHKPMALSEPLAALVGEHQLSRPQTVKSVWAYIKERDLQDPDDKRQIRCDDAMRAVFKQEKVHMFTMNKILASHLYALDE